MRSKYLVAICIVVAAFSVYVVWDFNGGSLDLSDRQLVLVVTDSMDGEPTSYDVPTIQKDSLVMVKFLSEDEKMNLKEGDVIQFWYHGILDHHRVVSVEADGVITHGDNVPEGTNEYVKFSDIRGKVISANHTVGEVFTLVKTYALVIIAFIVVLFIGSLLLEEIRRGNEKEE